MLIRATRTHSHYVFPRFSISVLVSVMTEKERPCIHRKIVTNLPSAVLELLPMTQERARGPASSGRRANPSSAVSATPTSQTVAAPASGVATTTVTLTEAQPTPAEETLRLTLRARPAVRWDENVVDNEGLGRKSSKRCCIFHKQRAFDESSTDSSDAEDSDGSNGEDDGNRSSKKKKIARTKKDRVPDYQRFHA